MLRNVLNLLKIGHPSQIRQLRIRIDSHNRAWPGIFKYVRTFPKLSHLSLITEAQDPKYKSQLDQIKANLTGLTLLRPIMHRIKHLNLRPLSFFADNLFEKDLKIFQ